MANTLEYILKLKDEATKELHNFGKQVTKNGDQMEAFRKAAGVAGLAITGFGIAGVLAMKDWASAAADAQKVEAQLDAVLKSTTGAMEEMAKANHTSRGAIQMNREEVTKLSTELSRLTPFEDEAITSAQSLMLTFTKIGKEVFPEATKVALDMSTAMGQDLQGTIVQLGKALQDPILGLTALRRVGVNFDEAQKSIIENMVKSGDLMGAQKLILKELTTEFGGSAEAAGKTFAGQLTILNNEIGNLKEALGAQILPMLGEFTKTLTAMVIQFNSLDPEQVKQFVTIFASMTTAALVIGPLLTLVSILPQLAAGITMVSTALGIASVGVIGIIALIPLLIGALVYLALNFQTLKENVIWAVNQIYIAWNKFWWDIQVIFMNVKNEINKFFADVHKFFADNMETMRSNVLNFIKEAPAWGLNLIKNFGQGIKDGAAGIVADVTETLNQIKKLFEGHSPPIAGPLKEIDKWGFNVGNAWVGGFKDAFAGVNFGSGGGQQTTYNQNMYVTANTSNQLDALTLGNILGRQWELAR